MLGVSEQCLHNNKALPNNANPAPKKPSTLENRRVSIEKGLSYGNAVSKITSKLSSLLCPLKASRGKVPDWACVSRNASELTQFSLTSFKP